MSLSLRARAFLLVAATNLLVFAAVGYVLVGQATERTLDLQKKTNEQFDFLRQVALGSQQKVNAARILEWPGWPLWEDSMFVVGGVDRRPSGQYAPLGLALNPVGAAGRGAGFDEQAVLSALHEAIANRTPIEAMGGRAVPVEGDDAPWGGVWYETEPAPGAATVARTLLPWFLGTTLTVTLLSFWSLRKLVLGPVEDLAQGALRVRAGDLSTRLAETGRTDEVADLVRTFNEMTATVQGFNAHLCEEVDRATRIAREAEAAAMTQRRLAAMGELAAGIAHEINNPLGGLQNAVTALERSDLSPDRRERYLVLLHEGLGRMRETVQRLLRFTPRPAVESRVNLGEVALDALDLVRHRAQEDGVRLVLCLPGRSPQQHGEMPAVGDRSLAVAEVPAVVGGQSELGQAVLNLLQNALDSLEDARPEAPRVEVSLVADEEVVRLTVEDNGAGVPEEELGRLADLFFTTKDVGRGSGLGLSIVHNVVASHRGEVRLANASGGGFLAEISIPRAPEKG